MPIANSWAEDRCGLVCAVKAKVVEGKGLKVVYSSRLQEVSLAKAPSPLCAFEDPLSQEL